MDARATDPIATDPTQTGGPPTPRRCCPTCGASLTPVEVDGINVDECRNQHGIWFDRGELEAYGANVPASRADEPQLRALLDGRVAPKETVRPHGAPDPSCPVCEQAMHCQVYPAGSDIQVDRCDAHGVWLDDGELERVRAWHAAEAQHGAPSPATAYSAESRLDPATAHTDMRGLQDQARREAEAGGRGPIAWLARLLAG